MIGYALICALGLAISLWLTLRQRASVAHRAASGLLQSAIWLLAWILFQPPALLPAEQASPLVLSSDTAQEAIPSPDAIAAAESLRIAGDGLPGDTLRDLPPVRLLPGESTARPGWQLEWPREVAPGEALQLQIRLQQGHQQPLKLTLEDPFGGDVDTTLLGPEVGQVTLQAWPKLTGNWLYHLRVEAESDQSADDTGPVSTQARIRTETLPVIVREPQGPRILLWLARPNFESAALARWLRQSATPAQIVTQLAPEIQRRETFNGQSLRKHMLLAADTPFDLVVLDSRLWPQLSADQRQQIVALSRTKSLLWLVDNTSPQGFLDYAREQGMPLEKDTGASVSYPDVAPSRQIPELRLSGYQPSAVHTGDTTIAADRKAVYWARVQPQQSLGFVFFNNSYRWPTAGYAREFALLWKKLFDRQLALRGTDAPVQMSTALPRAQQRLTLCSSQFGDTPPKVHPQEHSESVDPLQGIAAGSDQQGRCYSYWPQHPGWYQLETGSMEHTVYVFAQDAWAEWQTAIARRDTARMSSARLGSRSEVEPKRKPLPLYWIVLALLGLLTAAWVRERRSLR